MSKFNHFLGIDVSKEYFDAVVILNGDKNSTVHNQFTNNAKGLKELIHWLKTNKSNAENTLTCLEHTGLYGKTIIHNLLAKEFKVWVEMSLKIIRSLGIQRGKNDKIDAERIAPMLARASCSCLLGYFYFRYERDARTSQGIL